MAELHLGHLGQIPEGAKIDPQDRLHSSLFGLLGTFCKFIDRANLQTAFVSGMKENMSLYGDELNYANTAYNVGMIVALWPASLLLVRVHPKYFIP